MACKGGAEEVNKLPPLWLPVSVTQSGVFNRPITPPSHRQRLSDCLSNAETTQNLILAVMGWKQI